MKETAARIVPKVDPSEPLLSDWMGRSELADVLEVSEETLRRWQAQGIGPPLAKLGRRVLYRREAVRQWMVSREMGRVQP